MHLVEQVSCTDSHGGRWLEACFAHRGRRDVGADLVSPLPGSGGLFVMLVGARLGWGEVRWKGAPDTAGTARGILVGAFAEQTITGVLLILTFPTESGIYNDRFDREIVEVKQETDTRAVALARTRNITTKPRRRLRDGVSVEEPYGGRAIPLPS